MRKYIYFIPLIILVNLSIYGQNGEFFRGVYYEPMPMLAGNNSPKNIEFENESIEYDLRTQTVMRSVIEETNINRRGFVEGSSEEMVNVNSDNNRIFNSLALVTNTEAYPHRVNVKLFISYSGANFVCSGVLIDANHVLTAGHCIYNSAHGGWATSVTVVPGYRVGLEPYNAAQATNLYSWTAWTIHQDFNWDMGYMKLNRPVGGLTGWHGYGYNTNNNYFTTNNWINPGYPAEAPYNGQDMYTWNGTFDAVSTNLLSHNNLGYGGQSGSGTHIIDNGNRYVYSVASHTAVDPNGNRIPPLTHCRMVEARFNNIQSQIATNLPNNADLVAMRTYVEPLIVNTGSTFDTMVVSAFNYSEVGFTEPLSMSFYLSTNDIISTSDILLGTYTWGNGVISSLIRFNGWISGGSLPIIPSYLSSGTYYVGVIINNVDDNAFNNITSSEDVIQVTVNKVYCEGITEFHSPSRTFNDGGGQTGYGNYSDCRWRIQPFGADSIELIFSRFQTETNYDFVHVFGDLAETNLLWSGSGTNIPPTIVSQGDEMVVHFETDLSVTSLGFEATYTTSLPSYCANGTNLTDSAGVFTDGSGANTYINYSYCSWLISPPNAYYITLVIDSLDIENSYDFIRIYDGPNENNTLLASLSGQQTNVVFNSSGSELFVVFESDLSVTLPGWKAHYWMTPSYCEGTEVLDAVAGQFEDGSGVNNYNNNSDCFWLIEPQGADQVLLDFIYVSLENTYDFVRVYDGNSIYSPLLAVFTGDTLTTSILSTGSQMLVRFSTDGSVLANGFGAQFHGIYPSNCVGADIVFDHSLLPSGIYKTDGMITSQSRIIDAEQVTFNAGQSTNLITGFEVKSGGELLILSDGCQ